MTAGHLVLSAVAEHEQDLRAAAARAPLHAYKITSDRESWQLLVSATELVRLDQFTDDLAVAMGRRSRAGAVALALASCH